MYSTRFHARSSARTNTTFAFVAGGGGVPVSFPAASSGGVVEASASAPPAPPAALAGPAGEESASEQLVTSRVAPSRRVERDANDMPSPTQPACRAKVLPFARSPPRRRGLA